MCCLLKRKSHLLMYLDIRLIVHWQRVSLTLQMILYGLGTATLWNEFKKMPFPFKCIFIEALLKQLEASYCLEKDIPVSILWNSEQLYTWQNQTLFWSWKTKSHKRNFKKSAWEKQEIPPGYIVTFSLNRIFF